MIIEPLLDLRFGTIIIGRSYTGVVASETCCFQVHMFTCIHCVVVNVSHTSREIYDYITPLLIN